MIAKTTFPSGGDHDKMPGMSTPPYLGGHLLLAMPNIADPRFHRAVVFICAHDANGAMGLNLIDPQNLTHLGGLMTQLEVAETVPASLGRVPVLNGGPLETGRGFILHSGEFHQKETVVVNDQFGVTATMEGLQAIAREAGPEKFVFALGYAGWQAGQLEAELADNAWLLIEATPALVFDTPANEKWEAGMAQLGITPAQFPLVGGRA